MRGERTWAKETLQFLPLETVIRKNPDHEINLENVLMVWGLTFTLMYTCISILCYKKLRMTDLNVSKTPLTQQYDSCHTVDDIWIQDADAMEQIKKKNFKNLHNTQSLDFFGIWNVSVKKLLVFYDQVSYDTRLKSNKTKLSCRRPYSRITREKIITQLTFDFIGYVMNRLETTLSCYRLQIHLNPTWNYSPSITALHTNLQDTP